MLRVDLPETGLRLWQAINSKPIQIYKLAQALGVSRSTIGDWERGEHLPSIEHLANLARLLGCEPMDLIVFKEEEN